MISEIANPHQLSTIPWGSEVTNTMEPESYKKTGRGGAGNFYSKHDIEQATKNTAEVSKRKRGMALNTTTTTAPRSSFQVDWFLIALFFFELVRPGSTKPCRQRDANREFEFEFGNSSFGLLHRFGPWRGWKFLEEGGECWCGG